MILYRITTHNDSFLPKLGEEGWVLSCISEGKMYFWKEVKRVVSKKEISERDDFTDFWNLYPKARRKKKKEAQDFWNRLDEKRRTLALEGLKKYLVYWKKTNQDLNFISLPFYWLKGERYMDEGLDESLKTPIANKLMSDIQEEKKLEDDRKWMEEQLAKLKASGKWDEWYKEAREATPEGQRQYEMIILARLKNRLSNNPLK